REAFAEHGVTYEQSFVLHFFSSVTEHAVQMRDGSARRELPLNETSPEWEETAVYPQPTMNLCRRRGQMSTGSEIAVSAQKGTRSLGLRFPMPHALICAGCYSKNW